MRRPAFLALAIVAGAALLPLPSAAATTPTETEFVLADLNGDVTYGIYRRATPSGPLSAVAPDSPTLDHAYLSASQDGSRFAAVETVLDPVTGNPTHERVRVYDVSGREVSTVQDVNASVTTLSSPALSADGTHVVWTSYNSQTHTSTVLWASVAGPTPKVLAAGATSGAFVSSDTVLVRLATGAWESVVTGSGAHAPVTGLTPADSELTVSADHAHLAWRRQTTPPNEYPMTSDLLVAPISVTTGGVMVGAPVTAATGLDNGSPSFSRDSSTVWFVRDNGASGNGVVMTAPTDGSAPTGTSVPTTGDVAEQAIGTTDDGTPPNPVTLHPATLAGTRAVVRWSLPSDPDLSGVLVTRHDPSGAAHTTFVIAPLTSYTDSGLAIGSTYTYDVVAVDRSGNTAAVVSRKLTASAVAVRAVDPTSNASPHAPFAVVLGPATEPQARFTVNYRIGGTTTWVRWVTNAVGTTRTFTAAIPGDTYTFRVTAQDAFGNATGTYTSGRTVVPFDQHHATLVGGIDRTSSSAWLGTVRVMTTTSSYARFTATGDQLRIIGWRCRACGAFAVYDGRTLLAKVDTGSPSTLSRVVVFTHVYATSGTHTYTLRPLGTAGRPAVYLDGFAVRR